MSRKKAKKISRSLPTEPQEPLKDPKKPLKAIFTLKLVLIFFGSVLVFGYAVIFLGTHFALQYAVDSHQTAPETVTVTPAHPFPVGVDPRRRTITENPTVDEFFAKNISSKPSVARTETNWFGRLLGKLALLDIYQNLASPLGRILVIESGERKEEIVNHFAKILGWNTTAAEKFLANVTLSDPSITEGKFMPSTYTTARGASPEEVAKLVNDHFQKDVLSHYVTEVQLKVPLDQTLTIASLLEREAYDFTDMREISGIIWNRLFADMNLQIDATLQYAKGTKNASNWWPQVVPSDKYIASPYNTYKNSGLPPAPIANPSLDAILAALNPRKTDCMYYFHDKNAGFHCSVTYEEHVKLLKQYYGKGR